jgi:hypothetical protein
MGFWRYDDWRQLLMITNDCHMGCLQVSRVLSVKRVKEVLTPFIKARMVSGSVAMEASSIKTIGKSILDSFRDAADKSVVQICHGVSSPSREE